MLADPTYFTLREDLVSPHTDSGVSQHQRLDKTSHNNMGCIKCKTACLGECVLNEALCFQDTQTHGLSACTAERQQSEL